MFFLSSTAQTELREIWQYTEEAWGEKQADKYIARIYDKMQWLADNPAVARHRPEVKENCYCAPCEKHMIFFLRVKGGIDVVGIPHQCMDTIKYFDDM